MADTVNAIDLIPVLEKGLTADLANLTKWDNYLEGEQPLKYMSEAMKEELGDTAVELVLNWARLVADAYENRLDVEGFRYADSDTEDADLWACWQYNDMDEQSQQGHLDSLALSRAYVLISSNEEKDKPPRNTVESPFQVWAQRDPKTRKVNAAIKKWKDLDKVEHVLVYTPVETVEFVKDGGDWRQDGFKDKHNFGIVPVVPLVNKPRLLRPDGMTEFRDIIPLADAANKMATDMMTSAEFHAMPRRYAFGLKASDFVDKNGNPISAWSKIKGRLWASEDSNVKVGTFDESDLTNFHGTIKLLAQLTSQLAALPPHYMGFNSDNPPSADAMRSSESQLVKKVERKHTFLGGAWEDVQRINLMFMRGKPELEDRDYQLETVWRDPSTPTVAQVADAAVKKYESGLVPLEQTRIDLGYSATQREQMRKMDEETSPANQIAGIVKANAA
ncbi:phage portal protein [Rhodococcus sp. C3V]|uniref:phage portal protein n=1 Tax=Rhodococcus TaxID=1827 RepID=UPI0023E0F010|nr:phage portal protein [Rhodococcus sp. C3V]MDF3316464.1 phage portal protein [Rhodococcus sp. C3V]